MTDLLDELNRRIGGDDLRNLGQQMGTDESGAQRGVQEAIPVLLEALRKNASRPGGIEALERAIDRDHDGSILEDLSTHMQAPQQGDGAGILRHMFGNKQAAVESMLSKRTGLSLSSIAPLLITLAPVLLGMLGKMKQGNAAGSQSGSGGGILDILRQNTGGLASKAGCLMSLLPLLSKFLKR